MNRLIIFCTLLMAMTACSTSKNNTKESEDYTLGNIMILLVEDASPEALSNTFKHYQLKHVNQVSRHQNKWLYTFNQDAVSLKKLIIELGNESLVENIEKVKTSATDGVKVTSGTSGKKGKVEIRNK